MDSLMKLIEFYMRRIQPNISKLTLISTSVFSLFCCTGINEEYKYLLNWMLELKI